MTDCPVCHQPMPAVKPWRQARRVTCSRACGDAHGHALIAAREAEVDPAAVYRLTHGDPVTSTRGERIAATALLRAQGRTYEQIADALNVDPRSVARYVVLLRQQRKAA